MSPTFWKDHKNKVIGAVISVAIAGCVPSSVWIHNAYADARYVQQSDSLRARIQQIDNALFEIDQEIMFAPTDQERAKWQARKAYYERQKAALLEQLNSKA